MRKSKIRRQNLSAEFEQAEKDDIPLPRQAYGIDFYGHAKGEILVAIRTPLIVFWAIRAKTVKLTILHTKSNRGVIIQGVHA